MITVIKDDTEIPAGKFVCRQSVIKDGLCSYPREVTRVAGQRIYFIRGEGDREEYMARKSASYLCDTPEESKALADLGIKRYMAVDEAQKVVRQEVLDQFKPCVDALLAGQPDPGLPPKSNPLIDLLREAISLMPLGTEARAGWFTRASEAVKPKE